MEANALQSAITDLAFIAADGRLEELVLDHAAECRRAGLVMNDHEFFQPDLSWHARRIARAAVALLGVPYGEALRAANDVVRRHPRQDIALTLIDEYRGGHDQAETWGQDGPQPAPRRRPKW